MSRSKRQSARRGNSQEQQKPVVERRWRGRPLVFRLTAVLLGCLIVLVVAEISLRVIGYEPTTDRYLRVLAPEDASRRTYGCYRSNPNGDFSPLPDTSRGRWRFMAPDGARLSLDKLPETPWCIEYRLSSEQLRDREMPGYWPPQGQVRIACVGDSFTFGQGVPLERTLPRQLEQVLGSSYQIANVAHIGWDLSEEMSEFERFRKKKHCSRALLVFLANDLFLSKDLKDRHAEIFKIMSQREGAIAGYESGAWQLGPAKVCQCVHSYIYDWRIGDKTVEWYRDCFDPEKNAIGLDLFAKQLKQLANLKNCQVAMVIYPLMKGLENDYPFAAAHQTVAKMATEAGIPVLDLAPTFAGQTTSSLWVDPADQHPNSKAHAIAAEAIGDWLRRDLPEFLEPETRN